MSAFIGPIHYWLYGKIRLVTDREEYLFTSAGEICGETAEELREQVQQSYGSPLPDTDLGELIDHDNIHGWLQRQINITETREAAFVKELRDTCSGEAGEILEQAYARHGELCGAKAGQQPKYDLTTATGIYKALQDHYLNGMPCDQADMIVTAEPASVVWETERWLQENNWKRAGAEAKVMAKLYRNWLTGFVQGANPSYAFRQTADRFAGAAANRFEISQAK